jgi:hypothetical protein
MMKRNFALALLLLLVITLPHSQAVAQAPGLTDGDYTRVAREMLVGHGLVVPLCRINDNWGGSRALLIAIRVSDYGTGRFYLDLVSCWRTAAGIQRGGANLDVVVICACDPYGRLLNTWQVGISDVIAWEAGWMTNGDYFRAVWVY